METSRATREALREFRGVPAEGELGALPKGLGALAELFLERHEVGRSNAAEVLMRHWRELLGREADWARPERIDTLGTLYISVSNATVRRHLEFEKRRLLKRISELEGCGEIRELVLRAS